MKFNKENTSFYQFLNLTTRKEIGVHDEQMSRRGDWFVEVQRKNFGINDYFNSGENFHLEF